MISLVMMSVDPLLFQLRSTCSVYSLVVFDLLDTFSSGRSTQISLSSVLNSFKSCAFIHLWFGFFLITTGEKG